MRIAILAAGAVGGALGSLLWRAGEAVVLVGRAAQVAAIRAAGFAAAQRAGVRPAEIDDLNGEVVRMGTLVGVPTPLNAFVLALLRRVADGGRFLTAREIERAFEREFGPRHAAKQAA